MTLAAADNTGRMPTMHTDPLTQAPNVQTPAEAASPRVQKAHLGGVDWLRLLAIAGVAYYHAEELWYPDAPGAAYAFAGLHALTAASAYFACVTRSAKSDGELIAKRAARLLIPWLVFSLPFLLKAIHGNKFRWSMLWVGGSTHLWFLPFIFVVGCAISMLARRGLIVRSNASAIGWAIASIAAMAIEPYVGPTLRPMTEPIWQVANALPSVLMGIAIYAVPERRNDLPLLSAFAGAGAAVWLTLPDRIDPIAWPAAAACGAVLFGIARFLPIRSTPASAFVGRASFGVYLMHMVVLSVIVAASQKLLHLDPNTLAATPRNLMILGHIVLMVVASLIVVAICERTPLKRFIGG